MRIGIDIDNTISNTNELIIEELLRFDYKYLGNRGFKNKEAYKFTEMFNLSEAEFSYICETLYPVIVPKIQAKSHASEVINRLKKEGNEIYIITHRDHVEFKNPYQITKKWLKRNKIVYDKLIVDSGDKGECAEENKIDIFIDDLPKNCELIAAKNIPVLMFDAYYNRNENRFKRVISWEEIYNIIKSR